MLYMACAKFGWSSQLFGRELAWLDHEAIDHYASRKLKEADALIALSGSGLNSGRKMKSLGRLYLCDRGSSHIRYQDRLLRDEYSLWGLTFRGIDPRGIAKEEAEYALADRILVPSDFAFDSFIQEGVPAHKLAKIPYGADLKRFSKIADPRSDRFQILYVGAISIRKGFLYLLQAFHRFRVPNKRLVVVGHMTSEVKGLLRQFSVENIHFLGVMNNSELSKLYSESHVFVLPTLEEGLSMVQGEALACGCPVISTQNSGGSNLFSSGEEGFIVPIQSPTAILECLNRLVEDNSLRERMSEKALKRVHSIGGWDNYGKQLELELRSLQNLM